jgi:hypothetical protein
MAVTGTQHIVASYRKRTKSVDCRDVIGVDISNKFEVARFMLKSLPGGYSNMVCMNLAEKWAPEAIQAAITGLSEDQLSMPPQPMSCASEVVRKMGGNAEEAIMVSGFAGGIGFCGNACGALGAAIWKNTLEWCRKNPGQSGYGNPGIEEIFNKFNQVTGSEILCRKITGRNFENMEDHSEYLGSGGCRQLIQSLGTMGTS